MLANVGMYFPRQYQTTKTGKVKLRGPKYYKWFTEPHRLIYQYTEGEYQKIKHTNAEKVWKFEETKREHT